MERKEFIGIISSFAHYPCEVCERDDDGKKCNECSEKFHANTNKNIDYIYEDARKKVADKLKKK